MDANALTFLAILALLARGGHVMHTVGAVRAKSVADAAIRALVGSASLVLLLYLVGQVLGRIAVTPDTRGGFSLNQNTTVEGPAVFFATPLSLLGTIAVAMLPAALVEAATAERARLWCGTIVSLFVALAGGAAAVGAGWAIATRFDVPSAGLVGPWPLIAAHVVGGAAAIACARAIGPRQAKYNRDGSANYIPPHNISWLVAGDLMLLVGLPALAGFVAGDAAPRLLNALLAASAAVVAATLACQSRERRVDVVLIFASAVAGAIAGSLTTPDLQGVAVGLGAAVGAIVPIGAIKLDLRFRVDDPTGLALPHLLGGVAGAIGASLGAPTDDGNAAGVAHVLATVGIALLLAVVAIAIAVAAGLLVTFLVRATGRLRIDSGAESEGVDLALHDVNAYPDFQQTMIKSYHLRQ